MRTRERMKQAELRRALLVAILFCLFLFFYLYWQQANTTQPTENFVFNFKSSYSESLYRKNLPPVWTWTCINQRCERQPIKTSTNPVSMSTCSMLCGSTQLWPQPTGPVTLGSRAISFQPRQLQIQSAIEEPARTLLFHAFDIFNSSVHNLVPIEVTNQQSDISGFKITVAVSNSGITRLMLSTDESYTLILKVFGSEMLVNITAKTFFGARHAFETLSQLIWYDEYSGVLKILKGASIHDAPVFAYRGVMVDTARNYMSVTALKKVLVGMSACKLNVFHWHVTDSQSFPLVSPRVPQLSQTGAYSAGQVYSPESVRGLVEFARVRGIRVVLEVDTPAHAGNGWTWGPEQGLGELAVCVNERPWSLYCGEPPCGQLNPENPNVYNVLENLYKDLLELSGETEIFHLGGDEVNLDCWGQFLQKTKNYTDLHDLWGEFTVKIQERLRIANHGKQIPKIVVWSSKLSKRPYISKYLNKSNIVVQSWGSSQWPDTPDLIADGYKVILSHVDAWYLDCGFGRWRETGDAACDPYRPWQTFYTHRPWQQLRLDTKFVLGGEVCLWSEQFDEGSLDARLWPRTAAFAERVWSDPQIDTVNYNIQEDVYTRLSSHRERLLMKGINAEAIWPAWCSHNPGMCL